MKDYEKGCAAPGCEHGWVEEGEGVRPCASCRPGDFKRWEEAQPPAKQQTLRPPIERPELPPRRDLE